MLIVNEKLSLDNTVVLDDGMLFGKSVFETILVRDTPLFLDEHLYRLNNSLSQLCIPKNVSKQYITTLVQTYNIKNCVLKILVSEKNIILQTRDNKYIDYDYTNSVNLTITDTLRNETSNIVSYKTTNYLDNIIEHNKATSNGFFDCVFFNTEGNLAETSISNIFLVIDDKLFTPSTTCGLLDGIMRKFVITNFEVTETTITKDDLLNASEVFITNSLVGIMSVNKIDDIEFNSFNKSKIIRKTLEDFYKKQNLVT